MILRELRRGIDVESPASGSKEFRRIRVCQLAAPHVPGRRKGTAISSVIAPRIPADAGRNAIGDVRDRRTGRSIATKGSRASGQNGRKMPPRRSPRETRSTTPFDTTGDVSRRRETLPFPPLLVNAVPGGGAALARSRDVRQIASRRGTGRAAPSEATGRATPGLPSEN